MLDQYADKNVVVIADGAAFGAEICDIAAQQKLRPNKLAIYLPESFEWILLTAGVVPLENPEKLERPELYADSTLYMSWEQYFTALLTEASKEPDYLRYKKKQLPDYYLQERSTNVAKAVMKGIAW